MRFSIFALGATALALLVQSAVWAQIKTPLAELPSAPGPHLAKIQALGDNEWFELGSPAEDPKWGRARGRAWGAKAFALAPEIRGAYFGGEGAHGYVKPDGFGMDDYWVYDINAHRWICIYPGTDTNTFNQRVKDGDVRADENGQIVDKAGEPIPGHLIIHAWGFLTYDTDRQKFVIGTNIRGFYRYFMPGGKELIDEGLTLLEKQCANKPEKAYSPWSYDTRSGKFEHHPVRNETWKVDQVGKYPQFFYIPSKKQFFLAGSYGVAYYDPAKRLWTRIKPEGDGPTRGIDFGACHDTRRDRIYMGGPDVSGELNREETFFIYDLKTDTWTRPNPKGEFPSKFHSWASSVHYDTVNDVAIIMHYRTQKIYVYHPETNSWDKPLDMPVIDPVGNRTKAAFYDPKVNAYFIFVANDSHDNGVMFAYRYKTATDKE